MFSKSTKDLFITIKDRLVINREYELENTKFVNFINNYNYVNITPSIFNIIKDSLIDKKIEPEIFFEIIFKKKNYKNDKQKTLCFDNLIKTYKLINKYKILYIVIYYFKDNHSYGVIHYNDNSKKNIILLDSFLELILFLYKLELDMNLNPKYSRIINRYPNDFFDLNYYILSKYFNFESFN